MMPRMKARLQALPATAAVAALPLGGSPLVAARLAQLEQEVADGVRDARSLVAFPQDMVARAVVTFPTEAFGPAKPW